jgi:Arc/MetJ family transcription regulator
MLTRLHRRFPLRGARVGHEICHSRGCQSYLSQFTRIYSTAVTKRLVDVDDEKLEAVRLLLGTHTMKATVAGALDEVLALDLRRKELLAERGAPPAPLADPDERAAAWG